MPSLAAFILLAVVTGGTPSQRASIEKLVEGLPDCLTKPGGTAIPISIVPSGELNASYSPESDSLTIHDSLLDDSTRKSAVEELATSHCADPSKIKMFDDARRVLVHELSHGFFQHKLTEPAAEPGKIRANKRADGLLGTRFRQAQQSWYNDMSRREYQQALNRLLSKERELRAAGKTLPTRMAAMKCQLHVILDAEYRQGGDWMPSRFPNDRHVFDDVLGSEYFAIAIEMMIFDAASFCSTFSESEEKWLDRELGDCLESLMNGKPCSRSRVAPPAGAGIHRE